MATLSALLTPPGSGGAADQADPLPPTVADLHHSLRSSDHVIVYSVAPAVIEHVVIHEPGHRHDQASGESSTRPARGQGPGRRDADPAAATPGVAAAAPATPGLRGHERSGTTSSALAESAGVALDVPVSELATRHILDRVGVLVDVMRERLGSHHGSWR